MINRVIVISLLLIIELTSGIYGVTVDGLSLTNLEASVGLNSSDADIPLRCKKFNDLSQDVSFLGTITENVLIELLAPSPESLEDTDDESSIQSVENSGDQSTDVKLSNSGALQRRRSRLSKLNRSRHQGRVTNEGDYNPSNNYLRQWPDFVSNTAKSASLRAINSDKLNTPALCHQLTSDAFLISESDITDRPGSTTCFCVALRDQFGYVKKFVFHNGDNVLAANMRKKAQALGYDVIQTEQSHAEAQLIQFLLDRHQKRPGWYTHIMGMGCSRCHCIECDLLLKLYLGKDYTQFTASLNTKGKQKGNIEAYLPDTIKTYVREVDLVINDQGELIVNKRIERIASAVYSQDAIDSRSFEKFYLPVPLKDSIQKKLGTSISFDEERFTKSNKRIQPARQTF